MDAALHPPKNRPSPLRSGILLGLALSGLMVFILALGDARRERYAVEQARWHAVQYQSRVGESGVLPLNLEPAPAPSGAAPMISLVWPDLQTASSLREKKERILVAWTVVVSQTIRRDGRAVIVFDQGRFDARWMTEAEFAAAPKPTTTAPAGS